MTDPQRNEDSSAAAQAGRPTAREIADLLRDYRRMIDAAGGWAHHIPSEEVTAWETRKFDLLRRIAEHNESRERAQEHERELGKPGLDMSL